MAIPGLDFDPVTKIFTFDNKPIASLGESGEVTVTDKEFEIKREDVTHLAASALHAGRGAVFRTLERAGYSPLK